MLLLLQEWEADIQRAFPSPGSSRIEADELWWSWEHASTTGRRDLEACGKSNCQATRAEDLFQLLGHSGSSSHTTRYMKASKQLSTMMNCTKAGRYSHAVQKERPRKVIDLNEPMIREDQCWNSMKIQACVPRIEPNAEFAALDHESSFSLLLEARNLSDWVQFWAIIRPCSSELLHLS